MRLTEKRPTIITDYMDKNGNVEHKESGISYKYKDKYAQIDSASKLGQLEDIEDELGIDLTTLFKALKNGIWLRYDLILPKETIIVKTKIDEFRYIGGFFRIWIEDYYCDLMLTTYGKTWALTKEELL